MFHSYSYMGKNRIPDVFFNSKQDKKDACDLMWGKYAKGGSKEGQKKYKQFMKKRGMNPNCFVATAVYQNPVAEQVKLYRWFRDNYLVKTDFGIRFIDWYNRGGGQRLASFVERHPSLRSPSKYVLDIGALAIKLLKEIKNKVV